MCYGSVVSVVGVLLLPEIQPQDRVQKAVWQAAQTPGGHQQAACPDCQCEHPQAWDTATQSWYTACAVGLGHTDGAVAGTDDTDNWCSFRGFCSGCCSDDSVLSCCTVWDCELVVEGRAACIFMATEFLKRETAHASGAAEQTHDPVHCNNAKLSHNSDEVFWCMYHINVIITNLLYQAVPLEKLIVSQLARRFPAFYTTWQFLCAQQLATCLSSEPVRSSPCPPVLFV